MRYKVSMMFLFLLTQSSQASDLVPTDVELKESLQTKYAVLNNKITECRSSREKLALSDQKYLMSLTLEQKKVALYVAWLKAKERCIKKEATEYKAEVVDYAVKTGVTQPLNEWIALQSIETIPRSIIATYEKMNNQALDEFLSHQEVYYPFDFSQSLDDYLE